MNTQIVVTAHPANNEELKVIAAFFTALHIKFEVINNPSDEPHLNPDTQNNSNTETESPVVYNYLDDIWK